MVPWYYGNMVPWYHGTIVPWCHGTMVSWYYGTMVPWYHGTMVPWYHGTMVPWYHGTMVPIALTFSISGRSRKCPEILNIDFATLFSAGANPKTASNISNGISRYYFWRRRQNEVPREKINFRNYFVDSIGLDYTQSLPNRLPT